MHFEIIKTEDGSDTVYEHKLKESYHSIHGAVRESMHVYIHAGFDTLKRKEVRDIEVGFGTGLNAFLTAKRAGENKIKTIYYTLEKYPLEAKIIDNLNYVSGLEPVSRNLFREIHASPWEETKVLTRYFSLKKIKCDVMDFSFPGCYNLVYFDAFGPDIQPEMWREEIFKKIFDSMVPGGILVTYSSKGSVRRSMTNVGFSVKKLAGPPGKREIVRAVRSKDRLNIP